MIEETRFIQLDLDELYYIADKTKIRSLDYFRERYSDPEYEYTEDEIEQCAKDDYCQEIYENSMSGDEVIEQLNNYHVENYHLKKRIAELEKEVDYKKNTDACRVISDFIDYKKDVTNIIDKELDYWHLQKDKGLLSTCTFRVIDVLKRIKKEL